MESLAGKILGCVERSCVTEKDCVKEKVSVDQVVLIYEDLLQRMKWKLGLIIELFRSKDGIVRSLKLKTSSGETNRPITKLYPLEVQASELTFQRIPSSVDSRPKRSAALIARKLIREIKE